MKTIIKYLMVTVSFVVLLISNTTTNAQEFSTLYFSTQPQAAHYNPAFMTNNKMYVSIPVIGRMSLSLGTNGFAYNDLIHQHPLYKDSLQMDFAGFLSKLKDDNRMALSLNTDILGVGFKAGKNYFSFGVTLNMETDLGFSKGLIDFIANGTNTANKQADLMSEKVLDLTAYTSTYIGYAREINDRLTIGAKLKFYSGIANIHTNKSLVHLDFDGDQISAYGDIDFNASMIFGYFSAVNSVVADDSDFSFNSTTEASDLTSNVFKNKGFGFDVGATFKINEDMEISASIVDIGKITWGANAANIRSNNPNERFQFSGVEADYDSVGEQLEDYFDDLGDSLKHAFDLGVNDVSSYSTWVPTKIYLGYTWNFFTNMQLQALYYGRFIRGTYENSFTLNYSYDFGFGTATIGNTFNYRLLNPTAMITLGNIFYIGASFASSYNIAKTQSLSFFMGLNFALKSKKAKEPAPAEQVSLLEFN
jgi:hypothetical protein